MIRFALLFLLVASPALGQVSQPPPRIDTSALEISIAAARSRADAATAAIPPDCQTVPAADTSTGTMGTGTSCVRKADGASKTNVMPASAVTAADGSFSGSWPAAFSSTPTTAFGSIKSTTEPYLCQVGTFSTTTYAGKCWRLVQMTLPGVALSLLNLVLVPFGAPPTGSTVMVVGRQ